MFDSDNSKPTTENHAYWVALWIDLEGDGADAYEYCCGNHLEALELAVSEHKMAGRPLPTGTHYLVKGPCQDSHCDRGGKIRCQAGLLFPETTDRGWTN
jgi:hypothetical protein